ncbi:MHJ_0274 family protein [Mycoplasma sp. 125]|uniref:MHJ_0274 family protein n=1 Tax=Mycoplasma sp. 125 TaxID=3447505 RepID=UPI003F65A5A9
MGNGQTIVYVLLAIVLVLIIAYIAWKVTKNKRAKRKAAKLEYKKNAETLALYYEYIMTYKYVIDFSMKQLEKFGANESQFKMGQIKNGVKKILTKLINREDFAYSFQNDEKYTLFVEHAEKLTITQPNLWTKKINDTLDFFETQYIGIPEDKKNIALEEKTINAIESQFYEED